MVDFKTTEDRVSYVLEKYSSTRKSDNHLILAVYATIDKDIVKLPFKDAIRKITTDKRFPSFETISRCRRKIQANRPELRDEGTNEIRNGIMRESFKNYSLS